MDSSRNGEDLVVLNQGEKFQLYSVKASTAREEEHAYILFP